MPKRRSWVIGSLVAAVLTVGTTSTPGAATPGPEHVRVPVYVVDFDPLIDAARSLSVAQSWNDPLVLQGRYRADVGQASGGVVAHRLVGVSVVAHRLVGVSVVRGYPVKTDGFRFTNATYLGCLADSSPGYCGDLIDYGGVLDTVFDRRLGSPCPAVARGRFDEVWL